MDPKLAFASTLWLLRPSRAHTRDMLRMFVAPGEEPPETEVEWMSLMAANCRTTLAPPPLHPALLDQRAQRPCLVAVGEHDRFLPPRRLDPTVRHTTGSELHVIPAMGHLATPQHLDEVVNLVATVAAPRQA